VVWAYAMRFVFEEHSSATLALSRWFRDLPHTALQHFADCRAKHRTVRNEGAHEVNLHPARRWGDWSGESWKPRKPGSSRRPIQDARVLESIYSPIARCVSSLDGCSQIPNR